MNHNYLDEAEVGSVDAEAEAGTGVLMSLMSNKGSLLMS